DDAAGVLDLDTVAITPEASGYADTSIARGVDGSADRGGVIHALVGADQVEDRVVAGRVETRAHTGEFDRRAQEGLVEAATLGRVIVRVTIGIRVAHGAECAPLVDEFRRLDLTVVQVRTIAPDLLVGHDEGIPGTHVQHEVDVPAKNVRQ